jgi:DNA processing protein
LSKLSFEQLTDLRLLISTEGIGPAKIRNLLKKFGTISNILSADTGSLSEIEGIGSNLAHRIRAVHKTRPLIEEKLEKTLNKLDKLNANIITAWDKEFPPLLKKIYDPPLILYYLGSFEEQDKYSIGIVGTRLPTNYGKMQAEKIATDLSLQDITIVSGLARGIDSIAHAAAISNQKRTIAIIGSGLDVIYPPENKNLFKQIAESGLIISEFEPGTKPDGTNFPRRNRIISGLSLGCVIIETALKGGALNTARFALDQDREVFAVPGNLGVKQSEGTNLLIQKGEAKLITSAEDILVELELKLKPVLGENIPKKQNENLNIFEEKIYDTLSEKPLQIDKIAEISAISTSDCLVHLLNLEFKSLVRQLPGKVFARM